MVRNMADHLFYQRFESLGANCEFGLVQRRFGSEPLGLLRWPDITVQGLISTLRNTFSELSDISNFSLIPGPKEEWDVRTPHFSLHLYAKIGAVNEAELLASAFRRIQFLRRSLLENLEDAEKIFVFKEWQFRMSDVQVSEVFQELKRYNANNRFLAVRLCGIDHAAGSVIEMPDGLWLGFVESDAKISAAENVPFESWDRICRTVSP